MLDECIEHLADRYLTQKKYLEGFSMIDSLSEGWNGYYPCFDISGIKEQEEKEIDDILSSQLDDLAERGNLFLEQGNMEEALKVWQSAIDMIPEPKSMQAETVWFEASMADIYFMKKAFNEAQLLFERALCNLSGQGVNSFVFMRRGECQYELGNKKFAKHFLLQAYMLEGGEEIFKSEEQNIKYIEFLLNEMKKDEEARKHPFKDFDFTDFWDDSGYALESYVSEVPTDEIISEIEAELGYKLPMSYIHLMKQHNGGMPLNACFPIEASDDYINIVGIFGIGREKPYSLCGEYGSQFWIQEWDYPSIGVAICNTLTGGHDMIFLDYRLCGHDGEPQVVLVNQEDYYITYLAGNFEEFIRGLVNEDEIEE